MSDDNVCHHNVIVTDCTGFTVCADVDCRRVLAPSIRPNHWEIEPVIRIEVDDGTPKADR